MGTVRRRASGTWQARLYVDGRQRAKDFPRKIDAERWLASQTVARDRGEWLDPARARVTVGAFAGEWLAGKVDLKASTLESYRSLLRTQVLPRWGDVPLSQATHANVAAWVAEMTASGLGASRVRKAHVVLGQVLGLAVRDGRLTRNPADGVPLPRLTPRPRRYLTHEQVAELADAAGPGRAAILVLAYCGLRFGELAGLRTRDVDLLRGRLRVTRAASEVAGRMVVDTPKSHRARTVPIPGFVRDALADALAGRAPDDPAFPAPGGGLLREGGWRRRIFDPAVRAAGLDGLTPHDLRHAAASLAVAAGANVKIVQAMLGHASAAMTLDVYADLFDPDLDAVAERLDAAARAAGEDKMRTPATGKIVKMPSAGA